MKRRARRVTITAAVLGTGVVGCLVTFNWDMVRDHAEAWWFQATKDTFTVEPKQETVISHMAGNVAGERVIRFLADLSRLPVVYDPAWNSDPNIGVVALRLEFGETTPALLLGAMRDSGYQIVEQRFPRRAYVVVGYPQRDSSHKFEPILWDGVDSLASPDGE